MLPRDYARIGKNAIDGWLARCDAEILLALLFSQATNGVVGTGVAEIGVHHGKSFILLALSNSGRGCYAIDIFDRQEFNRDGSGEGSKRRFIESLVRFGIDPDDVVIDQRPSSEVTAPDILNAVGRVRLFHIDGGHHVAAVLNDLNLATEVLDERGVIVVDDVFRPEWPEVSAGLFSFLDRQGGDVIPFAIGFNKTYLCRRSVADYYRGVLLGNEFLKMYFEKTYKVFRDEVLVFQSYPLAEWGFWSRVRYYLVTYHPDLAFAMHRLFPARKARVALRDYLVANHPEIALRLKARR